MILRCDAKCKDGMIRIQGCAGGAPVVMSAPHFLHGDPTLWEAVDGLYPDPEIHETYIDIEPTSGVPLMAHKRIMVYCSDGRLGLVYTM